MEEQKPASLNSSTLTSDPQIPVSLSTDPNTQSPTTPPMPTAESQVITSPPVPKSNPPDGEASKKPLIIIAIVVALLVIVVAIVFAFTQMNKTAEPIATLTPSSVPEATTEEPSPTPEAMIKDMSDWKTYILSTLTFQYPKDYYPDNLTDSKNRVTVYNTDPRKNNPDVYYLAIDITENDSFELLSNTADFKHVIPTKVVGFDGYKVEGLPKPGGVVEEDYFFDSHPNLIHISIGNIPSDHDNTYQEFRTTVDQILSTFKFTN